MSNGQIYRVLFYAGTSLINTEPGCNEMEARVVIAEWEDAELNRNCRVEPALPNIEAPEVEGNVIPVLPAKYHVVTYETVLGEINVLTKDGASSDIYISEFMRELNLQGEGKKPVLSISDSIDVHIVLIDSVIHMDSLHPSDVVKPPMTANEPDDEEVPPLETEDPGLEE